MTTLILLVIVIFAVACTTVNVNSGKGSARSNATVERKLDIRKKDAPSLKVNIGDKRGK